VTYTKSGTYGTATLTVSTGVVSYALENERQATQQLTGGQSTSDNFTVGVIDNNGAKANVSANFDITGTNDAPQLSSVTPGFVSNNPSINYDLNLTGTLVASDVDLKDTLTYAIVDGASRVSSLVGEYGTLTINADHTYSYEKNPTLIAALGGADGLDSFTIIVDDGHAGTSTQTLDINIITPPAVTSITRHGAAVQVTNATSELTFDVAFNKAVTGLTSTDFVANGVNGATFTVNEVTGSESQTHSGYYTQFTVTVHADALLNVNAYQNVTIGLSNTASFLDAAGFSSNVLQTGLVPETYQLDHIAPASTQDALESVSSRNGTLKAGDEITVSYSPSTDGMTDIHDVRFDFSQFAGLKPGTVVHDGAFNAATGLYTYTYQIPSDGVQLGAAQITATVTDLAGNSSSLNDGVSYTVDNKLPSIDSIVRVLQSDTGTYNDDGITNSSELKFQVTFSEEVTNVGGDDFKVIADESINAKVTVVERLNASTYVLTVTGSDLDWGNYNGNLGIGLATGKTIYDAAGNQLQSIGDGIANESYTVDYITPDAPAIISMADTSGLNAGFKVTEGADVSVSVVNYVQAQWGLYPSYTSVDLAQKFEFSNSGGFDIYTPKKDAFDLSKAISVQASFTDLAGNTGWDRAIVQPAHPTAVVLSDGQYTNAVTSLDGIQVSGLKDISYYGNNPDVSVTVVFTGTNVVGGNPVTISKTYLDNTRAWSVQLDHSELAKLGEGPISYVATANDGQGNQSAYVNSFVLMKPHPLQPSMLQMQH